MTTNQQTNKPTNKIRCKIVFLIIPFLLCFVQSCSTEDLVLEQQSNIETVSKTEAVSFVKGLQYLQSSTAKSSTFQNDFDFDKITQEKLTNTSELLTVIPIKTKIKNQRRRALFLRVGTNIESMIYHEFAEASSTQNSFDGIVLMTRLNGDFIRAYRLKNNKYVIELVPNNKTKSSQKATQLTSRTIDGGELNEVVISNNFKNPTTYVSLNEMGAEVPITISWDALGSGGGGGTSASTPTNPPPSCESFNFITKSGSLWQESAVINIHFNVVVITPNGYSFNQIINFPNAILFGAPTNLTIGNTSISSGLAANLSAQAVQISMDETVSLYGNKPVSELTVRLYFEERLKHNYPLFIPGGRVNFNATSFSGIPTNYQTNMFGTGNCN